MKKYILVAMSLAMITYAQTSQAEKNQDPKASDAVINLTVSIDGKKYNNTEQALNTLKDNPKLTNKLQNSINEINQSVPFIKDRMAEIGLVGPNAATSIHIDVNSSLFDQAKLSQISKFKISYKIADGNPKFKKTNGKGSRSCITCDDKTSESLAQDLMWDIAGDLELMSREKSQQEVATRNLPVLIQKFNDLIQNKEPSESSHSSFVSAMASHEGRSGSPRSSDRLKKPITEIDLYNSITVGSGADAKATY